MEGPQPQRRDIQELLTRGFFTTARGKSPNPPNSPTTSRRPAPPYQSLHTQYEPERERSRPRVRRQKGPLPTVEDEIVSLARESSASSTPSSNEPPLRGIVDQIPIILEADITPGEAAKLQADPLCKDVDREKNEDRRFAFVPQKSDSQNSTSEIELKKEEIRRKRESRRHETSQTPKPEPVRKADAKAAPRDKPMETRKEPPPLERRRSRQDLPSLETKVPRDIPPQFRRSTSAFVVSPKDNGNGRTPKANQTTPQTPAGPGDYFLSPDVMRNSNSFSASAPRHTSESFGGRVDGTHVTERRASSRPGTPSSEKRSSGNFEYIGSSEKRSSGNYEVPRPRRESDERRRPKQSSEEHAARRTEKHISGYSGRSSTANPSRTNRAGRYYSSSEDDLVDSEDEQGYERTYQEAKVKKSVPNVDYKRHSQSQSKSNRSSMHSKGSSKAGSRLVSPLPSPKISPSQIPRGDEFERSQTFPRESERRNNSRPVSPHSALENPRRGLLNPFEAPAKPVLSVRSGAIPTPSNQTTPYPTGHTLPIPIPTKINLLSPGETRRTPSFPQYENGSYTTATPQPQSPTPNAKPYWQPPSFQPPSNNLEKPIGSYRRHSEDVERGTIAPLPSCPRTQRTRGRNDWLTLPNCPAFHICPQCFASTISPTEFRNHFILAAPKPPDVAVKCDFGSSPWYRIAWLLTLKERLRDLSLFYGLANVASTQQPCLGNIEGARRWHGIVDHKVNSTIPKFDVCQNCVFSVETLLPSIRGVFVPKKISPGREMRICDLRFDSKRFVQYFDTLEVTADRPTLDTRPLVSLARRLAAVDECQGDRELADRKWHVITQLPEFTVCEECFDNIVWPALDERKAIPMLFHRSTQRVPRASCQLYSRRMRQVFEDAVERDDYKHLASKARERRVVESAYKANVAEMKRRAVLDPVGAGVEIRRLEDEWRTRWE